MKLQHRAWLLVLMIVGLAAVGAMFGARYIVSDSFRQLEIEQVEREGERARRLLAQQLGALQATVQDYAWWADTAAFAAGENPSFPADNFAADSLASLRVSDVLLSSAKGEVITALSRGDASMDPLPPQRVAAFAPLLDQLKAAADPRATLTTYLSIDRQLWLVAGAAIHDSGREDASTAGFLLMARHFDQAELAGFSDVLMMPVGLSFDDPGHAGVHAHPVFLDHGDDQVHAVITDHAGRPVAELLLTPDRRLAEAASSLAWTGMGLALLAGLLALMVLVPMLDRLLLRRLQDLHGDVKTLSEKGPLVAGPIAVRGQDEIGQLAESINALVERVRQDHESQREAFARQEVLQAQLAQSQKTEALGRLTGGIAHDFNNSLAAITGWVRLAAEDLDDGHPSQEALQQAQKAMRYADGLMRQLLAFGRQAPPKLRRLHWTSLIEETRQLVASGLTRNCELVVDYGVDDDEVDADPTQLQQVMVNLLINAADAMQGKGRIAIRLQAVTQPSASGIRLPDEFLVLPAGNYLVLSIEDEGPGIPVELRQRLFEPFYTTKPKGKGTGLGLSVAQGIVARHHGTIGVLSEPGQGACFMVGLPVSRRDSAIPAITSPGGLAGEGRRVLFVDDDQLVRHAWSALLERKGWQVTRARDGEEAWAQFSQTGKEWDVVLTDQSMPRLDGVGLATRIREAGAKTPVVLMSGHVNEVPADALQGLFASVMHKPVEAAELERVLRSVVAPVSPQDTVS